MWWTTFPIILCTWIIYTKHEIQIKHELFPKHPFWPPKLETHLSIIPTSELKLQTSQEDSKAAMGNYKNEYKNASVWQWDDIFLYLHVLAVSTPGKINSKGFLCLVFFLIKKYFVCSDWKNGEISKTDRTTCFLFTWPDIVTGVLHGN